MSSEPMDGPGAVTDYTTHDEGETHEDSGATLLELIVPHGEKEEFHPVTDDVPGDATDFVEFFRMQLNPFSDSVNPAFFYKTDLHEETYIRMMLAIRHDIALGMVTGPSGTGKTLVSQMVLQNLDPVKYQPVLVLVSPGMSKTGLLKEILSELEVDLPDSPFVQTQDLVKLLQERIIQSVHEQKKLVFLVDEAHFLSAESLHMIRTISNIELPERKLTTTLMFAEGKFRKRLQHPSYESLRNRMYFQSELQPLNAEEAEQYIKYRLLVAGRLDPLFTDAAYSEIHASTTGIPRRINKLSTLALVEAFLRRRSEIDRDIVAKVAKEL